MEKMITVVVVIVIVNLISRSSNIFFLLPHASASITQVKIIIIVCKLQLQTKITLKNFFRKSLSFFESTHRVELKEKKWMHWQRMIYKIFSLIEFSSPFCNCLIQFYFLNLHYMIITIICIFQPVHNQLLFSTSSKADVLNRYLMGQLRPLKAYKKYKHPIYD